MEVTKNELGAGVLIEVWSANGGLNQRRERRVHWQMREGRTMIRPWMSETYLEQNACVWQLSSR
jgi:hypothetical protein